jgi:hypothetical protein
MYESYQALGTRYDKIVDRGEAHTLAAAVVLGAPALSNDVNALRTLERAGFDLPTVLQFFDLIAFCRQLDVLTDKQCDASRQHLERIGEYLPRAFRRKSFASGLASYCPRLVDDGTASIGATDIPERTYEVPIKISRIG